MGSVPAQMVANKFVTRYYHVLHEKPHTAYRFYVDESRLARAEGDIMHIAETQDEIHRVVTSLDHESWQPEIFTVDALNSFGGSVFVLVTGAMHQNNCTRKFVQSFILAPQDRGYYVLSDILRFLDELIEPASISVDNGSHVMHAEYEGSHMVSNAAPEASGPTPLAIGGDTIVREKRQLPENGKDVEQRGMEEAVAYQMNEVLTPANLRTLDWQENDTHSFPAEEAQAEKKSYAAILQLQRDSHTLAQTPFVSQQTTSYQPQSMSSHLPRSHPPAEERQEPSLVENEVDSRSVYVRNLPPKMVVRQLVEVMKKFGPVRLNSVSMRTNKDGALYAFVDFEDSNSAQTAIEASPIVVGDGRIYVEGRNYSGGRGRGRGQTKGMSQSKGFRSSRSYT